MVQLQRPADNRFVKATFFAPAGAGKTVLMGTAQQDERTSPMLILDFEGGTESLAGLDIFVAPIGSWEDYNEVYENLANGDVVTYNKGEEDEFTVDFNEFKSVGIDSVSETHKFALLDILRREGPQRKEKDALQQQDYGKATVQMRRLLREFRDLPLHVFFVAHAKEIEIPREGRVRVPDLAGQMAEELSGLMSVQGYLAQFEDEDGLHRTLLLRDVPRFRIKVRTPWGVVPPEEIVDPTITKLLDVLKVGKDSGTTTLDDRSSKGKMVNDEVPVDDEGNKLPGSTPDDAGAPDADDKPPVSDAETGVSHEKTTTSDATPADDEKASQNGNDEVELPDNFNDLSLKDLRALAAEHKIDISDARSRGAARNAIAAVAGA